MIVFITQNKLKNNKNNHHIELVLIVCINKCDNIYIAIYWYTTDIYNKHKLIGFNKNKNYDYQMLHKMIN